MSGSRDDSPVRHITCTGVTKPLPNYTHATLHNGIAYLSCVQGFVPETFDFPSDDPADQARQALRNLKTILEQVGSSMDLVIKMEILMLDMRDFPRINAAVDEAFPVQPPARGSIAVKELPHDAKVVLDVIAAVR